MAPKAAAADAKVKGAAAGDAAPKAAAADARVKGAAAGDAAPKAAAADARVKGAAAGDVAPKAAPAAAGPALVAEVAAADLAPIVDEWASLAPGSGRFYRDLAALESQQVSRFGAIHTGRSTGNAPGLRGDVPIGGGAGATDSPLPGSEGGNDSRSTFACPCCAKLFHAFEEDGRLHAVSARSEARVRFVATEQQQQKQQQLNQKQDQPLSTQQTEAAANVAKG
eukprot:TRINITY_DN31018_c0_g1_i1.p1 TRINITY_DN31018_c0_g1~~TRINITY_DN31018_c0_g1_i1.p1  ORF type:complete len:224 (-),score=67.94 TRINITY_DN31018_c0_g1_i1:158-829(-)